MGLLYRGGGSYNWGGALTWKLRCVTSLSKVICVALERQYTLHGNVLKEVKNTKYLGSIFRVTWNGIVTLTKSHLEQIVHLDLLSVTCRLNLAPLRRGHSWALFGRRSRTAVASGTRGKELRATVITKLRWSSAELRDGHCQTMTPKQASRTC